ncbi:MAG TPA: type 1 glutamine amidotransferase domain-containing protein [Methanoregula sp.]|nr:type 1 glutamine amidotransferase domain-containing protein [Methanoregula sp.]
MPAVLIPLPDHDFDTTEVSIPWKYFTGRGIRVVFATEEGRAAATDPRLLTGVIFGRLGAKPDAVAAYRKLKEDGSFRRPITYGEIEPKRYDAVLLPGGHAKGMRQYLGSRLLQEKVLGFYRLDRIIAAICHGVLVLARTTDPATGRSILYNRNVTALLKVLERTSWYLTAWRLGDYYRTYPEYVEDEVTRALGSPDRFVHGRSIREPLVVEDGIFITARWPGDARAFAERIAERVTAAGTVTAAMDNRQ